MAKLYHSISKERKYWDKKLCSSPEEWNYRIQRSSTVYVGNLSFATPEERIHEIFSQAGRIHRIVLGLNSIEKKPCGFAFVIYDTIPAARRSIGMFNGCVIDGRIIRVDADTGDNIDTDRKLARGINGYQWRDVFRKEFDTSRGGQGLGVESTSFGYQDFRIHAPPTSALGTD
ncbi:RNA recognition motif domain containing protein [Babesia bovis T2Bo]|uniref:Nuclear cap-binding protein subunit 2 n=1 Tax=Babesia bovis TaxID=5865 RepID=A7ARJ6_BABBO|nr:RNA recognition motif domain containing protein [Babesia bovis T2Bo]EDO07165.1 RNA recognition motif domain containing protein [Babesia bovis T2Bo]BAN64581.1 nuclear cap-binding protein, putative [Babesia bovis]|eukprot:XP_001610733.1 nuclear cap-binding protein [Babesia bovis T2Bo]